MIKNETTSRALSQTPYVVPRGSRRTGVWQRLAEGWVRAWHRSRLEYAIDEKVRRQFMHKPAEPGDVVFVNQIVEEISRGSMR
ncbi:MAG: hypothetical protein M0Z66_12605 [Thermaerobacter sp.]|nr:hypothetical protein [Thermaerobacter sp.]